MQIKYFTMISIDDVKKLDIRIGKILSAEKVPDTDKLLKLSVDFNEAVPRQVISGIAVHFPDPATLVGMKCPFIVNLEPRIIRGLESQAMVFASSHPDGAFSLLSVNQDMPVGSTVA